MKNLLIVFLIFTPILLSAQIEEWIEVNEIDEFTGTRKIATKWVNLNKTMKGRYNYARFGVLDSLIIFDFKYATSKVEYVPEGEGLMLKFEDGSILEFKTDENIFSCQGCGAAGFAASTAMGLNVIFVLNAEEIEILKNKSIVKWRLNTSDGYHEQEVKIKSALELRNAITFLHATKKKTQ